MTIPQSDGVLAADAMDRILTTHTSIKGEIEMRIKGDAKSLDPENWASTLDPSDEIWIRAVHDMQCQLKELGYVVTIWIDPWQREYLMKVEHGMEGCLESGEAEATIATIARDHGLSRDWLLRPPFRALKIDSNSEEVVMGRFGDMSEGLNIVVGLNANLNADLDDHQLWWIDDTLANLSGFPE
jgi:hypothetical protein